MHNNKIKHYSYKGGCGACDQSIQKLVWVVAIHIDKEFCIILLKQLCHLARN